jgi:NADPH:quinone reductase-like Zn-dependent oxidoreductase
VLGLEPGATLAVTGGAGLLASYAIALAKRAGLRVIADAKPDDADLVRSFGADVVVPRGDAFADAVRASAPAGVDGVLDTASVTTAAVPAVRDGDMVAYVRSWDGPEPDRGVVIERVSVGNALSNTDWLRLLANEASSGGLQLRVARTYAPEDAIDAYLGMEAGGLRGRNVITFG